MPVHGVSLAPVLNDPAARIARGPQYFEMLGHRGIWADGWKAVTHHHPGKPFDDDRWELYRLSEDFSEYGDLADKEPAKLAQMVALWWAEAEKHGVLPLDDRGAAQLFVSSRRPGMPSAPRRLPLPATGVAPGDRGLSAGGASLQVDGCMVAAGRIPRLLFIISSLGMDFGRSLSPVTDALLC